MPLSVKLELYAYICISIWFSILKTEHALLSLYHIVVECDTVMSPNQIYYYIYLPSQPSVMACCCWNSSLISTCSSNIAQVFPSRSTDEIHPRKPSGEMTLSGNVPYMKPGTPPMYNSSPTSKSAILRGSNWKMSELVMSSTLRMLWVTDGRWTLTSCHRPSETICCCCSRSSRTR